MDEYRTWRLCSLLHCVPSALEDESAVALDWLLAVDDAVARGRKAAEDRAMREAR